MSSSVWKFERSGEETLEKLLDIIQCGSTSQIKMDWGYRAELCMEPAGWDALWRIPRETCHALGVRFPCVVYVTVESLDSEHCIESEDGELCAGVEVVGVQDDQIHLPARHEAVPIMQLWPLKRQPNSAIEIKPSAEFIDLYRYFYTYIWMPWDMDWEGTCDSWFNSNVPARLNMWRNAAGAEVHDLRTIRDEAKSLARKINKYSAELPSDTEEDALDLSNEAMSELMVFHERMSQLKSKWQTYQNPSIRKAECIVDLPPRNISIWTGGSADSYVTHLTEVNKWLMNTCGDGSAPILHCSPSLQAAIMSNPPRSSKLILCPGDHNLSADHSIGHNLTIKSVSRDVRLVCTEERTVALAIVGQLTLEGITISADDCSTMLSVRIGNVNMSDCKLEGNRNITSQAIIVFAGTQLILKKCTFDEFFTGIMAHSGSTVLMDECTFSECGVGVQVCEGAKMTMSRCQFFKCSEAGVRYETQQLEHSKGGDHGLLKLYNNDITCVDCTFVDNMTYDVYVAKQDENAVPEWEDDKPAAS